MPISASSTQRRTSYSLEFYRFTTIFSNWQRLQLPSICRKLSKRGARMSIGPQRLGKYELQERLERGGMGEVWKAYDTQLRRHVAIKLLHANLRANPDFVSRFTREAQFVASLRHPNIIQVHD